MRRHILSVLLLGLALGLACLARSGITVTKDLEPAAIAHEKGYAYTADLSNLVRKPFRVQSDTKRSAAASDVVLSEDGRPVGPAHSVHDDIRSMGRGRYSHWNRVLIFSASDNTDPRSNNRRYRVETKAYLSTKAQWLALGLLLLCGWRERLLLRATMRTILRVPGIRWFWRNVVPGLTMTVVLIALILAAGEIYFRLSKPFAVTRWPSQFDPQVGFLFKPGEEVRHTNHLDFWASEKANSLGFLDHEPTKNPDPLRCHVVLIGDSFVEAAQVSNRDKVQTALQSLAAKKHPEWRVSASAFGFSGTGQLNQLPFYDKFARLQRPSLVVLVFVSNDFANNSTLLEAVRNGWHPEHPPRLFARRDPASDGYVTIPIDPEWQQHLLPGLLNAGANACFRCSVHRELMARSMFYQWIATKLRLLSPKLLASLEPPITQQAMRIRIQWLSSQVAYARTLRGWDGHPDMDGAFWEKELAPVFQDALGLSGYALDEFKRRIENDGGHLLVLASSEMSARSKPDDPGYGRRYFDRLKTLTDRRNIGLIDQFARIQSKGIDPAALRFRHDSHWSPLAHRVAAEMLLDYLESKPEICPAVRAGISLPAR